MSSVNDKRIARNTLMLYFRMFVITLVGLYTSRVVLNTLGVIDYGIYNVVGGIITMAAFLNSAMVAASQRFLSFELGRGDNDRLSRVFCTSINIHAAICVIAFLIAETIGLWFVNSQLVIPKERLIAANWVYQASIITFIINVMSVPYNSAIVAHERMSAFAYISILDAILRLLIVYLLFLIPYDNLIVFSILSVCVVVIIRICYTIYCKRHFSECKYRLIFDKVLFVEMFSFAGWSIIGNLGFSFKDQLSNIILNIYFGPSVNAARGIGAQIIAFVKAFANNFTMSLNPQITKQYAAGNVSGSRQLVYVGSRFTFYLLTIMAIPVIVNISHILKLWLVNVPKYTEEFVVLSILLALLYGVSECVTKAIQATGRIKWFQIGISLIMLSELPLAWLLLEIGYPPFSVMWPGLLTYTIAIGFRFWLVQRYIEGYLFREYFSQVLFPCMVIFSMSYTICVCLFRYIDFSYMKMVLSVLACFITSSLLIFYLGMKKSERSILTAYIIKAYSKINTKTHDD